MTVNTPMVVPCTGDKNHRPRYATEGAAGADLTAAIETPLTIPSLGRVLVPTGIRLAIPVGWEGQVRPRSGLAIRKGITLLNAPGTIDSDYRGEIQVILVNLGESDAHIEPGERIAQLIIAPVSRVEFRSAEDLDGTVRGEGGFGSTGT